MSKEREYLYKLAKATEGDKAVLTGGGGLMQDFQIVKVLKVKKVKSGVDGKPSGQATVSPDFYGKKGKFEPYLVSWRLSPISKIAKRLPLGRYFASATEPIAKYEKTGKWYDLKTGKVLKPQPKFYGV